jgi:hypothetical protein
MHGKSLMRQSFLLGLLLMPETRHNKIWETAAA